MENPNAFIRGFLENCNALKLNEVSDDSIHPQLFPFSLKYRTEDWLSNEENNSLTTWNALFKSLSCGFDSIIYMHKGVEDSYYLRGRRIG